MSNPGVTHHTYRFGEFTLDIERGAVVKAGVDLRLRPKAFDVLRYLVERHGQLVSKDELLEAVWSPAVVTDDSVTQCLMEIRREIGDHAQDLIRTVPRRGYIFDGPVISSASEVGTDAVHEPDQPPPAHLARRPGLQRIALLATLALALVALWWGIAGRHEGGRPAAATTASASAPVSIAVLPFADMSPRDDQAYFAEGMAEEILNRLANVPGLRVIARTSSFSFKGTQADITQIANRLHVDHVLEGSVRKSGSRLRVTVQLINAANSSHLWSHTYDREMKNVLQIQDDIAAAVAAALRKNLAPRSRTSPIIAPQAYEHYLQGRYYFNRRGEGDMERALHQYQEAVRQQPDFARAWAGLAGVYLVQAHREGSENQGALADLKSSAERALALEPSLAEADVRLGNYYDLTGHQDKAQPYYSRAVALAPNDPFILSVQAGYVFYQGREEEAIALQRRAVEGDPLSAVSRHNLAAYLAAAGRLAEAEAELRTLDALFPATKPLSGKLAVSVLLLQGKTDAAEEQVRAWPAGVDRDEMLAMINARSGRSAESQAAIKRLRARGGIDGALALAEVHAFLDDADAAFRWLAEARSRIPDDSASGPAWQSLQGTRESTLLRTLHADPRWEQWMEWLNQAA